MDLFLFLAIKKGDWMDDTRKAAIRIIQWYIRELQRQACCEWQERLLAQTYYSKIAAVKLLQSIKTNKSLSPLTIVENFGDKMNRYACMNDFNTTMFSIQADAAEFILDEIVVYKERRKSKWTNQN